MRARIVVLTVMTLMIAMLSASTAVASYKKDVRQVSKRVALYDLNTGDAMIIMNAVFFTDTFRVAFADKSAAINHLSPAETETFRVEQGREQQRGWEIFMGMYARKAYREFSLRPDTFWKAVFATEAGENVAPIAVEKIKVTPYWRVMFPNLTHWDAAYRVVFPKVALGGWASLTMQSVIGEATVTWEFKEPRASQR